MRKTSVIALSIILLAILLGVLTAITTINPDPQNTNEETETPVTPDTTPDTSETKMYQDPSIGLSFAYESGADGYHLAEVGSQGASHVKTIVLTDMDDYVELMDATAPREGPPSITIQVYKNTNRESATNWADAHEMESNIGLVLGTVKETVLGGANAVRYLVDGLYPTDTVVVAHGSFVYVVSGSYLDDNSPTRADFNPLLASISFIPES